MRTLILSAGLGTRLSPYTDHTPKPLFTVAGRPLLDITITNLIEAGCESIIINTHHLHEQIEAFIARQDYSVPVQTRYEPRILGTGGAIINVQDFWNDRPFMVINSDIVTTIDFREVYDFHCRHENPATLVLADDPEFNSVEIDADGFVATFYQASEAVQRAAQRVLTFTGIQVLDRDILKFIDSGRPSSSIDAYRRMIAQGKKIRAYVPCNAYWKDIGTAERYKLAVFETITPRAFQRVFPGICNEPVERKSLKGDGSDRQWYRLKMGSKSMILVDHGIRKTNQVDEVDAFVNIGRYLFERGLPVPQIYEADTFAGYALLEDLGNDNLQSLVQQTDSIQRVAGLYQRVIDLLIKFSESGAAQFDTAWCYQTARYSKTMILEKECRYFVDAFLNAYLGLKIKFADLKQEFEILAENALKHAVQGLMHRDFQSRNIMINDDRIYFIDFQGARLGPIQYDLASLLIDPYVDLPQATQTRLMAYAVAKLHGRMKLDADSFERCYRFCCLSRNLQILGAFANLTCVKSKAHFAEYIPAAVRTLRRNLKDHASKLPALYGLADAIVKLDPIKNLLESRGREK